MPGLFVLLQTDSKERQPIHPLEIAMYGRYFVGAALILAAICGATHAMSLDGQWTLHRGDLADKPDALRIYVECPDESERRDRLKRYYAYKGFSDAETETLIGGRDEEHDTVAGSADYAQIRVALKSLGSAVTHPEVEEH